MSTLYAQCPTLYQAGSGNIIGATSIVLTSLTDIYGNVLTMSNFGALGYCTAEPDTTNAEAFTFTGVVANANGTYTLTGVKTVLAESPYTQTSGLVRNHAGGTKVVITDNVAFWDTFINKNNDSTLLGKYTFDDTTKRPALLNDTDTANPTDIVTFGQLSRQAIAGAANASTSVKGLSELSTQAEADARTTTGGSGAKLVLTPDVQRSTLLSDYKADTGAADAYVITPVPAITAYTAGQIFSFKATSANTTTSTLNVNGLGVKTIKKAAGATNLVSGDIAAGMIVEVEYDGTNFVMLNPVANAPTTAQLTTDIQIFSTAGTASWTKPTGAKWVEVTVIGAGGGGASGNSGAGGGGGGGYGFQRFNASVLGSTESYTVGAGAVKDLDGGYSSFGTTVLLKATGGIRGTTGAGGAGGTANGSIHYAGGAGGGVSAADTGVPGVDSTTDPSPRGGGGSAYNNSLPNNAATGGAGGAFTTYYVKAGATGGANTGAVGSAAPSTSTGLLYGGVGGGGGGRAASGAVIGGGGAGNLGSGGGGGGVTNGGGTGGDGMVVVVTYF